MIQPVKAYKASDGTLCESVEEVQRREVYLLVTDNLVTTGAGENGLTDQQINDVVILITEHRDKLLDILTTGPRSRPARRTINGATTKKRKAKPATPSAGPVSATSNPTYIGDPVAISEDAAAGFAAMRKAVEEAA